MGDFVIVRRKICFIVSWEHFRFADRISRSGREFFVSAGLLVADKAVDFALIGKVEIFSFPSITGVTRCATSLVALDIDSEVVDRQPPFSQFLVFGGGRVHPGPVNGFMELK